MLGSCILGRWLATLRTFIYFWLMVWSAVGIAVIIAILLGGEISFGLIFGLLLVMAAALTAFLIWDVIQCLVSPTTPPPQAPPLPGALTTQLDCPAAQQQLADARAKAAQLQAELDAQVARIAAAQHALNVARMSLTAATAALAGAFFTPWALPAALAAVAAATWLTYQRAKALESELARLESIANRLAAAMRDLAVSEAMTTQACATPMTPPAVTVPAGIGLTTGSLQLIARGAGQCRTCSPAAATAG